MACNSPWRPGPSWWLPMWAGCPRPREAWRRWLGCAPGPIGGSAGAVLVAAGAMIISSPSCSYRWDSHLLEWGGTGLAHLSLLPYLIIILCFELLSDILIPGELWTGRWHNVDEGPAAPVPHQLPGMPESDGELEEAGRRAWRPAQEWFSTTLTHCMAGQVKEVGAPLLYAIVACAGGAVSSRSIGLDPGAWGRRISTAT